MFRYEIRRWQGGTIPDLAEAVASPVRISADLAVARHVLDVLPSIPTPVWGRDDFGVGEMWNSNSVIAWALARGGADVDTLRFPTGRSSSRVECGSSSSEDPK